MDLFWHIQNIEGHDINYDRLNGSFDTCDNVHSDEFTTELWLLVKSIPYGYSYTNVALF